MVIVIKLWVICVVISVHDVILKFVCNYNSRSASIRIETDF